MCVFYILYPYDAIGSVYVYQRLNTLWSVQYKLFAKDFAASDNFGTLSMYDTYAIIGSRGDDEKGDASGMAYVM